MRKNAFRYSCGKKCDIIGKNANGDTAMKNTTLCYIEKDGKYLMLHRVKKVNDENRDKWIGVGGHMEERESPEECVCRETLEETGLTLTSYSFRGVVTFVMDEYPTEYMFVFTADGFKGEMHECDEGVLEWVDKDDVCSLPIWEGDKIFLKLLRENSPFFSLKLEYAAGVLKAAALNGKKLAF